MTEITDTRVKELILVIRNQNYCRYFKSQLAALQQLKRLSKEGNSDARTALQRLKQIPDLPLQLQEFIRE
jgi:hypothetical protein